MSGKCLYCGKETDKDYCSDICEQQCYAYLGRMEPFRFLFFGVLIAALALCIVPIFVGYYVPIFGVALFVIGVDLVLMPFAPPFVFGVIGAQRAERLLKIAGYVLVAVGVVMVLTQFFD